MLLLLRRFSFRLENLIIEDGMRFRAPNRYAQQYVERPFRLQRRRPCRRSSRDVPSRATPRCGWPELTTSSAPTALGGVRTGRRNNRRPPDPAPVARRSLPAAPSLHTPAPPCH